MISFFILLCGLLFVSTGLWVLDVSTQTISGLLTLIQAFNQLGKNVSEFYPVLFATILGMLFSVAFIFSGIFLSLGKEWARRTCAVLAFSWIVLGVYFCLGGAFLTPLPAVLAAVLFLIFHVIPAGLVVLFLNSSKIKAKFK